MLETLRKTIGEAVQNAHENLQATAMLSSDIR